VGELFIKEGRGRSCLVNESHHVTIKSWIENNPNLSIENIQLKICNELKIQIGRTATYNLIRKMNLSYITPRPIHHKADIEAQESLKKTSMG
jgi:transposase